MRLKEFIKEAKKSTYAAGDNGEKIILPDGGIKYIIQKEDLEYTDIYYGFDPFLGQELVKQNGKTIWGMNYIGYMIDKKIDANLIFQFLQKTLKNSDENLPLRGPKELKEKNLTYVNDIKGNFDLFVAKEKIYIDDKCVYELDYHGGIKK